MCKGVQIGLLHDVLDLTVLAHHGANCSINLLVVAPHQDLEQAAVAGSDPLDSSTSVIDGIAACCQVQGDPHPSECEARNWLQGAAVTFLRPPTLIVRGIARMRKVTTIGVAAMAAIVLLLLAIGRGEGDGARRRRSKSAQAIAIDGARFHPDTLVVPVNHPVEWVNHDPYPHNVTSSAGSFTSGNLTPNGRFRFTPAKRGTFGYVCTLHPGMKAVLRVQ